ncbi:MAG: hypothetical protein SOW18_05905 [Peptoniphilus sp.]|nr:hypothetical protein [Peptoniphilus sp.]MDY3119051.1 hypothetical protein [Peptoniphilus sp.]
MRLSKMKLSKKLGYVALLGVLVMPYTAQAVSVGETFASKDFIKAETPVYDTRAAGGNTTDTAWSFTLRSGSRNSYTAARKKTNNTAAYVKLKSCDRPRVGVVVWIPGTNCKKVQMSPGDVRYLRNNAPVGSMITLAVESGDGGKMSATGVWSPNNTSNIR